MLASFACGNPEPSPGECLVATVSGVEIRAADVEVARAEQTPRLDEAHSESLLLEATIVWIATEGIPEQMDAHRALASYKEFLRGYEHDHGGTTAEWVRGANQQINQWRTELDVVPGPCSRTGVDGHTDP
jgi:hypothetical protein